MSSLSFSSSYPHSTEWLSSHCLHIRRSQQQICGRRGTSSSSAKQFARCLREGKTSACDHHSLRQVNTNISTKFQQYRAPPHPKMSLSSWRGHTCSWASNWGKQHYIPAHLACSICLEYYHLFISGKCTSAYWKPLPYNLFKLAIF